MMAKVIPLPFPHVRPSARHVFEAFGELARGERAQARMMGGFVLVSLLTTLLLQLSLT
jgi:hypothetical protein